jgi:hypothetical protein
MKECRKVERTPWYWEATYRILFEEVKKDNPEDRDSFDCIDPLQARGSNNCGVLDSGSH